MRPAAAVAALPARPSRARWPKGSDRGDHRRGGPDAARTSQGCSPAPPSGPIPAAICWALRCRCFEERGRDRGRRDDGQGPRRERPGFLVTRGLAELTRLALALGARRETLMGLAGLGDLLLTATSLTSRNTSFGFALAHGRNAAELMASGEKLSEGAYHRRGRMPTRPAVGCRAADRRGRSRRGRGRDQRRCRDRCPAGAAAAAKRVVH